MGSDVDGAHNDLVMSLLPRLPVAVLPHIGDAEAEITLSEERAVVTKETVPKERVRLEKDVVEDIETVSGEVRKEQIEVEGDVEDTTTQRGRK